MKNRTPKKSLLLIGILIAGTCMVMAYQDHLMSTPLTEPPKPASAGDDVVEATGKLTRNKIAVSEDGNVSLALTLSAKKLPESGVQKANADMVIVLDRSGSMDGEKISNARNAVARLISELSEKDRLSVVTYSDGVQTLIQPISVTSENRRQILSAVRAIRAGGGTNLGAGLAEGVRLLTANRTPGNIGRLILISDGLANQGVTDPVRLGETASLAMERSLSVSTVGVGVDFNEELMTLLADRGAGSYYFLENPDAFAAVFLDEFRSVKNIAANTITVKIPLSGGVSLKDASGYPVETEGGYAVFHPGSLMSGQKRKFFLTFRMPTNQEQVFKINDIEVHYIRNDKPASVKLNESFEIACVKSREEAAASIDRNEWEEKVTGDEYNKLKEEVARDLKRGRAAEARQKIESYRNTQQAVNSVVKSDKVAENLEKDLPELESMVEDTFAGAPAAVEQKQKQNSKLLQYEGYKMRRSK